MSVAAQVFGYISLACWIVLFLPQIHTTYRRKSGEGLSILTVLLWIAGDAIGLVGSILSNLLLSQIILAAFFLGIDVVLLGQIMYYRRFPGVKSTGGDLESLQVTPTQGFQGLKINTKPVKTRSSMEDSNSPTTAVVMEAPVLSHQFSLSTPRQRSGTTVDSHLPPLAPRQVTTATLTSQPTASQLESGNVERRSMATLRQMTSLALASLAEIALESVPLAKGQKIVFNNGNATSRQGGRVVIHPHMNVTMLENVTIEPITTTVYRVVPMADALGWICYSIYILSRFPQIYKNWKTKSTDGLSKTTYGIRFVAQITYLLSIFLTSTDPAYLRVNLPWIVGTCVNFLLDGFIVGQMWYYGRYKKEVVEVPQFNLGKKESIYTVDVLKTSMY